MKDIFDEVDFSNVFSHLKDVIRTPEKLKQHEEKLEDHPPVSDVRLLHIYLYYDVWNSTLFSDSILVLQNWVVKSASLRYHCFILLYSVPYPMILQDSEASIGALLGK